MASIISPIFTVVDTVMWSCTQIVYGGIYLFNINIQLVSVVLLGLDFILHQLLSALYMIFYALASVLQSTTNLVDLLYSLADGSAFLLNYIQEGGLLLATWIIFLVPNTVRAVYTLILWIQQAVVFLAYNILPVFEQAGTLVIAGLKSLISYSAHFTVVVAMSITTLFTLLIHGLYKLFALTVYTVYSALNETYQFVVGNSKPHEIEEGSWPKRDENENPFWTVHLDGLKEPVTVYDSVHESVSQFVFQIFEVMSYLAICIAVICAVIAVVTLFYCLYRNAMSSVNALVSLFHRSLFRSEQSIIMDMPTVPPQAVRVTPGPYLRENLDDLSDAESEDSIRVIRRPAPTTPIPVLHVINNDIPGPSGYRAPPRSRSQTPVRSRSQTPKTTLSRLDQLPTAPGSPTVLARDLRRQLEEERDRKLCVVCQDNDKNILIFPCKHLCVCFDCVDEIASSSIDRRKCPLCRGRISSYLEVYA